MATSNAVRLSGSSVTQYQVGVDGPVAVSRLANSAICGSTYAPAALRRLLARAGTDPLQTEYTRVKQRGLDTSAILEGRRLAGTNVTAIRTTSIPLGSPVGWRCNSNICVQGSGHDNTCHLIVQVDRLAAMAARPDVARRTSNFDSQRTGHWRALGAGARLARFAPALVKTKDLTLHPLAQQVQ